MTPNRSVASDEENRAVSPVVGVAILVGITVILASVVGAFVFGLVSIGESSPDASFTFSQETSLFETGQEDGDTPEDLADGDTEMKTVRVTHNSGDAIQKQQLVAKVSGNKSDPQSNESVYEIDYQGDTENDDWKLVLNDTTGENSVFKPGSSFVIGFYGAKKTVINNDFANSDIRDYNTTDDSNTNPGPFVGFDSDDNLDSDGNVAHKLGECDLVEIVWRSDSGAQGQVLQTYQVPGTECA